jgi:parallel beta-helix repeat protein
MAILKVRQDFPTIQAAVDAANPGDVILVEEGTYAENVFISSDFIRIIAKNDDVILNGGNTFNFGFELVSATGVEIRGFKITDYTVGGIELIQSFNNRIINNNIINNFEGISIFSSSSGNLIWKNTIKSINEGIFIESNSNWIVKNDIHDHSLSGLDVLGFNNAFIDNSLEHNKIGAFIDGINNLFYVNKFSQNEQQGNILEGADNSVLLQNLEKSNSSDGLLISDSSNVFVSQDELEKNVGTGVRLTNANFNIIEKSEIEKNLNNGISGDNTTVKNLIYKNDLDDNQPHNILLLNPDNNLLDNDIS